MWSTRLAFPWGNLEHFRARDRHRSCSFSTEEGKHAAVLAALPETPEYALTLQTALPNTPTSSPQDTQDMWKGWEVTHAYRIPRPTGDRQRDHKWHCTAKLCLSDGKWYRLNSNNQYFKLQQSIHSPNKDGVVRLTHF